MITQALEEIKKAKGENFDPDKVNLALISRMTGLSRSRLRRIKANGFIVPEHGSKGKVERLIRFVKENFMAGRVFSNVTELNQEALRWCERQNSIYQISVDCIPEKEHGECCLNGFKTYFLKASELNQKFTDARRNGR